ncbi:MAG: hypothetical protein K6B72_04645 [Lachnospiraceae bacterium]|nr:hypothetical protein [Lachnospiraceae bacterium]
MQDEKNAASSRNRIDDELLDNVSGGTGVVTDPALMAKQREQAAKKKPMISATRRPRN